MNNTNNKFLIAGVVAITIVYLVTRLPFFVYIPLPEVIQDSISYLKYANQIRNGDYFGCMQILPPGLPFIYGFLFKINDSLLFVIIFQVVLSYLASIFMYFTINKHCRNTFERFMLLLSIMFFCIYPTMLGSELGIMTESLYTSVVFLIITGLYRVVVLNKIDMYALFFILSSIFLLALLRSNGIYIYFLIPIVIYFLAIRNKLKSIAFFISTILILNLIWSAYNYNSCGYFMPSTFNRILYIQENVSTSLQMEEGLVDDKEKTNRLEMFKRYITSLGFNIVPPVYLIRMETRFSHLTKSFGDYENFKTVEFLCVADSEKTKEFQKEVLKDYYEINSTKYKEIIKHFNINDKKNANLWGIINHYIHHVFLKIHNGILLPLVYYLSFLWFLIKGLKSKFKDNTVLFCLILFFIHFLSFLVLTFAHSRFGYRYIFPTEIAALLLIAFFISDIFIVVKKKYSDVKQ